METNNDYYNFINNCIEIITRHLKLEINTRLSADMSLSFKKALIESFCESSMLKTDDIVGYFEDGGKIFSGIYSAIVSKPSLSGLVFFKDRFYYRNGIFSDPVCLMYEDIKYIESKLTKLVIYKDKINHIVLNGISYAEPTEIEKIFKEIHNLNAHKIQVTKKDKLKNFAVNTLDNVLEIASNEISKSIKKAEQTAIHINDNPDKFTDEQIENANNFLESDTSILGVFDELKMKVDDMKANIELEE